MPEKLVVFLATLSDDELDALLTWADSENTYEEIAEWVSNNRYMLANKLFGDRQ